MTKVILGSLDLFWFPHLANAISTMGECELFSTWSPRKVPSSGCKQHNILPLQAMLSAYKRLPFLQRGNHVYLSLCRLFDIWLARKITCNTKVVYTLSGCGLKTNRAARSAGGIAVVECGSTHTDFQHNIVLEEYKRNGLHRPLFPEAYRARVRQEFEESDYIQVPSEFVRQTFLAAGIPDSKILKARYGTDIENFSVRSVSDISPVFRVICPSGVNIRKGARILVEAWRRLGWRESEAELHWIGCPGHPEVRHLFKNPVHGIVWHGYMDHKKLATLYASCDVLTLPSFEEGLARVLIEAAASGLALIATPNTGVEDLFSLENHEGWLIPCNCVDSLCEALKAAKADREKTFEIGQRAARRARDNFSWNHYGQKVRENLSFALESRS